MKTLPVGAESFHADVQTDRRTHVTKLTVAFRNFANGPVKCVTWCNAVAFYLKSICSKNPKSHLKLQSNRCFPVKPYLIAMHNFNHFRLKGTAEFCT
jgi:hypothetical protein